MKYARMAAGFLLVAGSVGAMAADPDPASLARETRETVQPLLAKVSGTLRDALKDNPPHDTVDICRDKLPGIVKDVRDRTGWSIRRVSLKTRNLERGTPDEFEARMLAAFDQRVAAGEKPETLEAGEIVTTADGKVYRYMKALPVQEICLSCHGDPAAFSPDLKARLAKHYPADKATGYSVGQLRGAITVKRPLPN